MSVTVTPGAWRGARQPVRRASNVGDRVLLGLCATAGLITVIVIAETIYQLVHGANLSFSTFGLGFVYHTSWQPNLKIFGAGAMLFGTVVTAAIALALATPLGVAIGIFLALLAPPQVRAVVGPLVEMLAAIPSVVLGLWGVIVLGPVVSSTIEPFLHNVLGFLPIFGAAQATGLSVFTAGLILTIMIVPIIASLSRDLFLAVPRELQDGAAALGATRWEVIRGVVLPTTASGVVAAALLGLGRALGEAVAVAEVIGGGDVIRSSLFQPGNSLASRIVNEFNSLDNALQLPSLYYAAVILLVIGLLTNSLAQLIASRLGGETMLAR